MMFHLAPPEVNGLGSITSTPGLIRSAQVLMFLGLPFRTANTTTESVTIPSYSFRFQSSSTRPASTSRVMSGSSENPTTSAGSPPPPAPEALEEPPQPAATAAARIARASRRAAWGGPAPRRIAPGRRLRVRVSFILHLVDRLRNGQLSMFLSKSVEIVE